MDYISWVEQVAEHFAALNHEGPRAFDGIHIDDLALSLDLQRDRLIDECIVDAMTDLKSLGLVDDGMSTMGGNWRWKATQEGLKLREISLRTAWPSIFDVYLTEEQLRFLQVLCTLSEQRHDRHAQVTWVPAKRIAQELGQDWDDRDTLVAGYETTQALARLGLTRDRSTLGGHLPMHPTYAGFVRATQMEPSEHRDLVASLLTEGETANVDYKRELNLVRDAGKAEFIRDILALANTRLSGRRFLLVGVTDEGDEYATPDPAIDQERLEQIVHAWTEPAPRLRTLRVRWNREELLLIEVLREAGSLPYLPTRSLSKLKDGVVYVRHGSHTEAATPTEERMLREEGDRARQRERRA